MTGSCDCACRDCFNVTSSDEDGTPGMCCCCDEAGCERGGECQQQGAYEPGCPIDCACIYCIPGV